MTDQLNPIVPIMVGDVRVPPLFPGSSIDWTPSGRFRPSRRRQLSFESTPEETAEEVPRRMRGDGWGFDPEKVRSILAGEGTDTTDPLSEAMRFLPEPLSSFRVPLLFPGEAPLLRAALVGPTDERGFQALKSFFCRYAQRLAYSWIEKRVNALKHLFSDEMKAVRPVRPFSDRAYEKGVRHCLGNGNANFEGVETAFNFTVGHRNSPVGCCKPDSTTSRTGEKPAAGRPPAAGDGGEL